MLVSEIKTISLSQFPSGTFLKIGFFCNIFFWGFMMLVVGGLAANGADILKWNNEYVYGFAAVWTALFATLFLSVVGSVILMLGGILAKWASGRFGIGEVTILTEKEIFTNTNEVSD